MRLVYILSALLLSNLTLYCQKSSASKQTVTLNSTDKPGYHSSDNEYQYSIGDLSLKSKHINLGYVNKGEVKNKKMPIVNRSRKPLKIEFEDVPSYIEIMAEPLILEPGSTGYIDVKYHSENVNDWDYIIDRVMLVLNHKKNNKNKLAITANICEDFSKLTSEQFQISPVATYQSTTQFLDTLKSKNKIELAFIVTNTGRSDLIIRDVNPSCGCTAVKPEKYIVAPGDSTTITATFDPKGKKGAFNNAITVITNDPKNYRQYLWLKGYIRN
jgi:hypothetical protein